MAGRAAAGLDINTLEFGLLPPHFDPDEEILSVADWESILPNYSSYYPHSFRSVLPFLLASLVYHRGWLIGNGADLKGHLQEKHPFRASRVVADGWLGKLKDKVHLGTMSNPVTKLTASGIPPHLGLTNEIQKLGIRIGTLEQAMTDACDSVPEKVATLLEQRIAIDGVNPVTRADLENLQSSVVRDVGVLLQDHFRANVIPPEPQAEPAAPQPQEYPGGKLMDNGYRVWWYAPRA